ncbi:lysoplasmalogenase [Hoeflea olei]|uniref:Lysoplasmalogenase n=1 Tax=Hoeflea olei TaxID=1480615 RepID=A0A1C1YXR6_9HYPH|nr:lysoplasmalogenase [Hoeflea olei]OCW58265.1 hypothetical protein AWJ14_21475 [Hoeflea olei]
MTVAGADFDTVSLVILALSVLASAAYLTWLARPVSLPRTIAKTLAVGLLCLLALSAGGPWLLVLALALSALGDAFLAHEGDVAFLGGLGSFLAGHIAYAVLFLTAGPGFSAAAAPGVLAIAIFAVGMGYLLVSRAGPLAVPVAIYVLAIAVMGAGGVTMGGYVLVGAVLFIASDAILGSEKFLLSEGSPARRLTAPAVWVLYYAGQALITLGLLA